MWNRSLRGGCNSEERPPSPLWSTHANLAVDMIYLTATSRSLNGTLETGLATCVDQFQGRCASTPHHVDFKLMNSAKVIRSQWVSDIKNGIYVLKLSRDLRSLLTGLSEFGSLISCTATGLPRLYLLCMPFSVIPR